MREMYAGLRKRVSIVFFSLFFFWRVAMSSLVFLIDISLSTEGCMVDQAFFYTHNVNGRTMCSVQVISSVFFYAQVAEWRDNDDGCVVRLRNRGDRLQITVFRLLTLKRCEINDKFKFAFSESKLRGAGSPVEFISLRF